MREHFGGLTEEVSRVAVLWNFVSKLSKIINGIECSSIVNNLSFCQEQQLIKHVENFRVLTTKERNSKLERKEEKDEKRNC
jgi:hypothetical protein